MKTNIKKDNIRMNKVYPVLITLMLYACNTIDKAQISVIEDIQLGKSYNDFPKQLDSLGLKSKTFFTQTFFTEINAVRESKINLYYSDIFNFNQFRNKNSDIYALIYPTTLTGTNNVIGLNILLGHTFAPSLITDGQIYNLEKEYNIKSFNQNVPVNLLNSIEKLLNTKYGAPTLKNYKSEYNDVIIIEGSEIKSYIGDKKSQSSVTKWETEYLEIELYSGVPSNSVKLTKDGYEYTFQPSSKAQDPVEINFEANEQQCNRYAFIKYSLKSAAIKKLNINQKKV